jgi:hypothetical protein
MDFHELTLAFLIGRCGHGMSKPSHNTICKECAHHYRNQMHNRCSFVVMLDSGFKNGLVRPTNHAIFLHHDMPSTTFLIVIFGKS